MELIVGGCALILLLPASILFIEVAFSLRNEKPVELTGPRPRLAILIPAHNEAGGIAGSLKTILPQIAASDRVIVIADNCSDNTCEVARLEGAEVVVRTDGARCGKGYAMDFGIQHLLIDPPEIVIFVDADCLVANGAIDHLARYSAQSRRPVQAQYLMHAPKNARLNERIAEFAFLVKNVVRPRGLRNLGLPCQLMGTGMAFPWSCIRGVPLASGLIVEDVKLGLDLAEGGHPPQFCPGAHVTSYFASTPAGHQSQRVRWEHGHLGLILSEAPRLLLTSLRRFNYPLLSLALDLSVPPLALLTLMNAAVWIAGLALFFTARSPVPLVIATISSVLIIVSVCLSWLFYGRQVISLASLGFAIVYAIFKIPLYAKFLVARQMAWVRAKRDDE